MIKRTIGILGLLASIMALSSLIYGSFQEPLLPYMQGIVGGILELYRTMRDALFSGLGLVLSALINWLAQWVDWLPPMPWFELSAFAIDVLVLMGLILSACISSLRTVASIEEVSNLIHRRALSDSELMECKKIISNRLRKISWELKSANFLFKLFFGKRIYLVTVSSNDPEKRIVTDTMSYINLIAFPFVFLFWYVIGAIVFFTLAYAENQIGL